MDATNFHLLHFIVKVQIKIFHQPIYADTVLNSVNSRNKYKEKYRSLIKKTQYPTIFINHDEC